MHPCRVGMGTRKNREREGKRSSPLSMPPRHRHPQGEVTPAPLTINGFGHGRSLVLGRYAEPPRHSGGGGDGAAVSGASISVFADALLAERTAASNTGDDDALTQGGFPHASRRVSALEGLNVLTFLSLFAEPVSRPRRVHEYLVTSYSVGRCVASGITAPDIIAFLARHCAGDVGPLLTPGGAMRRFIEDNVRCYNVARVVVSGESVRVECADRQTAERLLADAIIRSQAVPDCRIIDEVGVPSSAHSPPPSHAAPSPDDDEQGVHIEPPLLYAPDDDRSVLSSSHGFASRCSFELIDAPAAKYVAARAWLALSLPLVHEYDFASDATLPHATFELRRSSQPRAYQYRAVAAAVDSRAGRCSSGVIILPCGAGKTLVGIMLLCAVKRPTVICCASAVSVEQWLSQLHLYAHAVHDAPENEAADAEAQRRLSSSRVPAVVLATGAQRRTAVAEAPRSALGLASQQRVKIACLTGKRKDPITSSTEIVIVTYSMLATAHRLMQLHDGDKADNDHRSHAKETSSAARQPAPRRQRPGETLLRRSWGLVILDEAHMVPAEFFQSSIAALRARATVGLTATYVREDAKIVTLHHFIGPKLCDIAAEDLRRDGYLATVLAVEVRCPMSQEFAVEYATRSLGCLNVSASRSQGKESLMGRKQPSKRPRGKRAVPPRGEDSDQKLFEGEDDDEALREESSDDGEAASSPASDVNNNGGGGHSAMAGAADVSRSHFSPVLAFLAAANPSKLECAAALLRRHAADGKVLICCDQLLVLRQFATRLGVPYICGETSHGDRMKLFSDFQATRAVNVLCVSRVGDISVNLPCANVVIQVSSHGGSRRQELQRLGRVLRPKGNADRLAGGAGGNANTPTTTGVRNHAAVDAFFYSLVSDDTLEVYHASRRTAFLRHQGYSCTTERFARAAADRKEGASLPAVASTTNDKAEDGSTEEESRGLARRSRAAPSRTPPEGVMCRMERVVWLAAVVSQWEVSFQRAVGDSQRSAAARLPPPPAPVAVQERISGPPVKPEGVANGAVGPATSVVPLALGDLTGGAEDLVYAED